MQAVDGIYDVVVGVEVEAAGRLLVIGIACCGDVGLGVDGEQSLAQHLNLALPYGLCCGHELAVDVGNVDTVGVCNGKVAYARAYLRLTGEEDHWGMMQALWATTADLTVVQAQDILGLGSEARMNIPSTVGTNWRWRALPGSFTPELADRLRENMQLYRRLPE